MKTTNEYLHAAFCLSIRAAMPHYSTEILERARILILQKGWKSNKTFK